MPCGLATRRAERATEAEALHLIGGVRARGLAPDDWAAADCYFEAAMALAVDIALFHLTGEDDEVGEVRVRDTQHVGVGRLHLRQDRREVLAALRVLLVEDDIQAVLPGEIDGALGRGLGPAAVRLRL
jgi:hypothetical protein